MIISTAPSFGAVLAELGKMVLKMFPIFYLKWKMQNVYLK